MLELATGWLASLALLGAALGTPAAPADDAPPNLVVFLVDDLGWQDLSEPFHAERTPFNERYRTPNVERLADSGMKFTDGYAHCVCSPTRVSLMTGWNPARHRVTNWTLRPGGSQEPAHPRLVLPEWNVNGLQPSPEVPFAVCAPTLPGLLREAGYRTLFLGKAHFGALETAGADPLELGFDVNVAGHAAGAPGSYLGEHDYSSEWRGGGHVWDVPGLEAYYGTETFLTEALTLEAIKLLDAAVDADEPFFLYLSHYAVHTPIEEDARFMAPYVERGLDPIEARYAALVEGMDRSLGLVLDALEEHEVADRTVVVFLSDNGGLSAVARGGEPHTHNLPLSSGKGSAREGGVRVPWIVRAPGLTSPGSVCDTPIAVEDLLPTLLELAGAPEPEGPLDGRSFAPLLRDSQAALEERALVWHFPNHWGPSGPGIGAHSAIRRGDWKLIHYHDGPRYELFDLASDLGETRDRVALEPERARALADELGAWLESVDAQMPRLADSDSPLPFARGADLGGG